MTTRELRDGRVNLRAPAAQLEKLRQAAAMNDVSMTEFILANAVQAAEQVLADRRWFVLDDLEWDELQAALDRPAVFKPSLADLIWVVGIRCLVVHAKDEAARSFYLRCARFEKSPTDPLNLQLLVKDLRLVTGL